MRRKTSILVAVSLAVSLGVALPQVSNAAVTPTLILSGGNAVFGLDPAAIKATASTPGLVAFSAAGEVIKGCESAPTTATAPFVATCLWLPKAAGATALTATLTPTDLLGFTTVTSPTLTAKVGVPGQGVVSPIHIYVDTVLASGTSGPLAPRFGVSCAITNEYLVGQGIVFRVYANNADQGGAVLDSSNTEKAYIEISGVKEPLKLSYGNHSGIAFWTAVLRTGAAPAYNTLGVINYKVTMVAKDQNTMKVLSTKLVAKKVDGKRVIGEDGRTVYERVSYYRTRSVSPPLKGATGTYVPNWTAASLLTLFALPKA